MKHRDKIISFLGAALSLNQNNIEFNEIKTFKKRKTKKLVMPKNCKIYYFNNKGDFEINELGEINKEYVVFICLSINDKNVIRKYNKNKLLKC